MSTPPRPPTIAELCIKYGLIEQSKRKPVLTRPPRIGQYYWVHFPNDAFEPEFVQPHPGIVIKSAQSINDTCTIIPVTSTEKPGAPNHYLIRKNPHPKYPNVRSWAVCDHPSTLHVARLKPLWTGTTNIIPKVDPADMEGIYALIRYLSPRIYPERTTILTETTVAVIETGN